MTPRPSPSPAAALVILLAAGLPQALAAPPAAAEEAIAEEAIAEEAVTAGERFRATVAGALEASPAARRDQTSLEARAAEDRAAGAALAWSTEFQREGLDGSFDDEPNAAEYLRLATPFNLPHQARAGRRLGAETSRWLDTAGRALLFESAAEVGGRWLELAAVVERVDLAGDRLERLERALFLERKKLELGEVAGTEVMQLELERARDLSLLRAAETRREVLAAELRALAGAAFAPPRTGDLEGLVEATATGPPGGAVDGSVLIAAAESEAEIAGRRRDLERALVWGRPEAEIEFERVPDLGPEDGFNALGFRVAVPLPFGKAGRERRAAADLRAAAAEAEAERRRREIAARLESAERTAQNAAGVLEDFAPTLARLGATEHSLAEQFRLGAVSYLIYIDGLARLDGVRLEAVEARRALLQARLELAVARGDPSAFPLPYVLHPDVLQPDALQGDTP